MSFVLWRKKEVSNCLEKSSATVITYFHSKKVAELVLQNILSSVVWSANFSSFSPKVDQLSSYSGIGCRRWENKEILLIKRQDNVCSSFTLSLHLLNAMVFFWLIRKNQNLFSWNVNNLLNDWYVVVLSCALYFYLTCKRFFLGLTHS